MQTDYRSASVTATPVGTLHELVRARADETPLATAIVGPDGRTFTYARLRAHVDDIGRTLRTRGVARGDRVALVLRNRFLAATTFVGVATSATCAPLNPQSTRADFERALEDLQARAVITDACAVSDRIADAAIHVGLPLLTVHTDGAIAEGPSAGETAERSSSPCDRPDRSDVALVLQTSGTTARPKCVPLTHANLCASATSIAAALRLTSCDRCFNVMPLFHIHGLVGALLSTLVSGGTTICPDGFERETFLDTLVAAGATWYTAVPTIQLAVLAETRERGGAPVSDLRFIRSCSAALAPSAMQALEDVFGVPVIEAYGMTEASHQMTCNPLPPLARKPGSVGVPTGTAVAILDEQGSEVPTGLSGEICIKGASVMSGYERNPAANEQAFCRGWLRTGDRGFLDADGYLFINGRIKELINRGGEKVAPREIDEALMAHPDVSQAVGFAIPHPTLGEDVAAAVVLAPGHQIDEVALREFALARLGELKAPQRIIVVDELPRGATGKLLRIGLADVFRDRLAVAAYVAPRDEFERRIASVWGEILESPSLSVFDDFFSAGGDSLQAVLAAGRLRRAGISLTAQQILKHRTAAECARVSQLAAREADGRALGSAREARSTFAAQGVEATYPLTPHQREIHEAQKAALVPRELLFVTRWRIRGELDVDRFQAAWRAVTAAHAILRTAFFSVGGEAPVQVVRADARLDWQVVDLANARPSQQLPGVEQFIEGALDAGMDASCTPLFRIRIVRLGDGLHDFSVIWHHGIMDLWMALAVMQDVLQRYASDGGSTPIDAGAPSFREYVSWINTRPASDETSEFWRSHLARVTSGGAPANIGGLPKRWIAAGPPGRRSSRCRETRVRTIGVEPIARATRFVREHQLTLGTLAYGAWAVTQSRYQSSSHVLFMTTVSGRGADLPGADSIMGPLFSTHPFCLTIDAADTTVEWLGCLQADHLNVQRFDFVEPATLEQWAGPLPPAWSVLMFQNMPPALSSLDANGLHFECFQTDVWLRRPVALFLLPEQTALRVQLIHDPALVTASEAEWMLAAFERALDAMATGGSESPAAIRDALPELA